MTEGYQVYMNSPATLNITGFVVNPTEAPIGLPPGWNMAGYLRETVMPIDQALASID